MRHFSHFQVRQVTPLSSGLLVERQVTGELNGLPTLFTLLHPMGDLCPVLLSKPASMLVQLTFISCVITLCTSLASSSVPLPEFFTDPQLYVAGSCQHHDFFLLLYHTSSGTHSVWEAKPAKLEVCILLQQIFWKGEWKICYLILENLFWS